MQNEKSRLKIHTGARPDMAQQIPEEKREAAEAEQKAREKKTPGFGLGRKKKSARPVRRERRRQEARDGMTAGEKLLRNTAVACALLLTVLSLNNIDQPWSQKLTEGVRQAMTMRIDWDETLGRLSFVRSLVPETALVFLNLGQRADLNKPVDGEITHEYTEQQPWLEYRCSSAEQVICAADGVVTAAGQGAGSEWIILVQSEDGLETVYGYLADVYVKSGQEVKAGQQLGATAERAESRLYFEVRENGVSIDPTGRLK